jgi:hypothetical protein
MRQVRLRAGSTSRRADNSESNSVAAVPNAFPQGLVALPGEPVRTASTS